MADFQDELIFHVDFNNVRGNQLKGSLPHASHSRVPADGERAVVCDWEGNQCQAVITGHRGQIVYFVLDEATWSTGGDVQVAGVSPVLAFT